MAFKQTGYADDSRPFCTIGFQFSAVDSYVVSGVAVLNTAGLGDGFSNLWMTAWFKSWIVAFPAISVLAPLTRRFVAKITKP
jgi:hypothetical protein